LDLGFVVASLELVLVCGRRCEIFANVLVSELVSFSSQITRERTFENVYLAHARGPSPTCLCVYVCVCVCVCVYVYRNSAFNVTGLYIYTYTHPYIYTPMYTAAEILYFQKFSKVRTVITSHSRFNARPIFEN
jgi:hypothetical protein